ncbi:MAG TPA: hypothetical protein VF642_10480, partial [Propionibacteriaceae bacterium]
VVHVYPDYAESCLWLSVPVDYALTGLSDDLVDQLKAWEQSYYDGLTSDLAWRSAEAEDAFSAVGRRLGRLLARELGDGFEVEVSSTRIRGRGPASNPRAEAAFRRLADERRLAEDEQPAQRT